MFKKTFFIAALAIVGASASANAATLGEANSAIGAISGCSGAACDSSIQAAIAAVQSLPAGAQRDTAASDLVAAIANASAGNTGMSTQMASYAANSCTLISNPEAASVCANIEVAIRTGQPQTATAAIADPGTGGNGGYDGATRGDNFGDDDAS
ncbi:MULTISPECIES: hypothetical protein [unclassified Rhizobium]|uniref:hypothetical protein n=1 Tax=unclassified Rhizobium TaxID=2613769 RepID=UPI0007016830|nr:MULTISPECIES: hypothetical protein [unclassified Rhizobium]KQV44419.1 hypothetical protein ASC86_06580 [Rhizobium sp. Root1212]KRD38600.1 hypothetical protein ASE37_06580 [Rhizobium sp. Root268]